MGDPDVSGLLRRIRRTADLSQRELAAAAGLSPAAVAHAEAGTRELRVGALARAAAAAGFRLVLVDERGAEVAPMAAGAVRDRGGRRFPAHLDTRHGDLDWWHGDERYSRPRPWYTYDRDRGGRDGRRAAAGAVAGDHQLPQAGDSPADRAAARRRAAERAHREDLDRRRAGGELRPAPEWTCRCPPGCDALEDWQGPPRHVDACACGCDPC